MILKNKTHEETYLDGIKYIKGNANIGKKFAAQVLRRR